MTESLAAVRETSSSKNNINGNLKSSSGSLQYTTTTTTTTLTVTLDYQYTLNVAKTTYINNVGVYSYSADGFGHASDNAFPGLDLTMQNGPGNGFIASDECSSTSSYVFPSGVQFNGNGGTSDVEIAMQPYSLDSYSGQFYFFIETTTTTTTTTTSPTSFM